MLIKDEIEKRKLLNRALALVGLVASVLAIFSQSWWRSMCFMLIGFVAVAAIELLNFRRGE